MEDYDGIDVIITKDEDWISVITEVSFSLLMHCIGLDSDYKYKDDLVLPPAEELLTRIMKHSSPRVNKEDGI